MAKNLGGWSLESITAMLKTPLHGRGFLFEVVVGLASSLVACPGNFVHCLEVHEVHINFIK